MNNYFYLQAVDTASVVKLVNNYGNTPDIKYSRDGSVWYQWNYGNITIQANTKMYFKGNNGINFSEAYEGGHNYSTFTQVSGSKVLAGGNIMSLLDDGACTRTEVGECCFWYLFNSFKGLDIDDSFVMPATTLGEQCYVGMFAKTSLTKTPTLPATTLPFGCYYQMFKDCTSLNNVTCLAEDISSKLCTTDWLSGVSGTGTFTKSGNMSGWTRGVNGIPVGWNIENHSLFSGLTFTALEDGEIGMSHNGTNSTTTKPSLSYSKNGSNWVEWDYSAISVVTGDKVYFKGNNDRISSSSSNYSKFTSTGKFSASGNIMSLLYGDGYEGKVSLSGKDYCFINLFNNCSSLDTAPELPATTLSSHCYEYMFNGCDSLINAPALPATTLAPNCYYWMFCNCNSFTTAPSLPATTLTDSCYANMFYGCTALVTAPDLPATTLANSCYASMFSSCTKLKNAPSLPATTLTDNCYEKMFVNCTALVTVSDLPANTLANNCCWRMFRGCSSLTQAPFLPATEPVLNCYKEMFFNCRKLNYIKCLLKPNTTECTTNWVNGVAASGTFVKNNEANNWERSVNGIPTGWTVENYQPTVTNYTLTVRGNNSRLTNGSSTNIGDVTFDVSAVYAAGTSVTIGCKPKSGYRFVQWNDGNTNSERTVVVNSDITYTATVVKTYRIIAQDESVHHCYVRGTGVYDENSVAELTVEPFEGYMFSHWEDNSTDLPRHITVTEDKTVWAEAVLAPQKYTVTLQGDNCTLNGGGTYNEGTTVEISCIPNTGYYFVRWSDGNTNATRTITVTENITLTAITAQGSSKYLEIKARKGSGEYERTNIIWYLDYKVNSFIWDARVYTDFDNLTTNFEISDNRVTNISKGSSWIGDSRIYSFEMTVPRNDSDINKEFTINITSNNGILSDNITVRVIQKPKLPVLIEDIFVSSGDVENALVTIPDTMGEVLVVYEDETLARYTIDDCVSNYVLYYRNALGGIDLFPVTGKVIKSNNIEHLTINKKYDNRTLNFGKTNYENVLTERWQLYSGRLTDQQSKLMHHLINSTYVYLYDIQADKFTPVVITDTEMEYKTYKNNNNKMVYYTINVEASQTKYRR